MGSQLLEIQPPELKFSFEVKKQSSCRIRLSNDTTHYVAFKVKTTSPKKYCVRPNIGVVPPKTIRDFIVTMQGQKEAPPDMICKDKFLIQSTVVPAGTTDDTVTPSMFAKDGRYIEEHKMKVILDRPPYSPVLSPINGTLKMAPAYEASVLKDQTFDRVDDISLYDAAPKDVDVKEIKRVDNDDLKPVVEVEEPEKVEGNDLQQAMEVDLQQAMEVDLKQVNNEEEMKLAKDIEELKSKLVEVETKLGEAEGTISRLMEESRLTIKETQSLHQELALLQSKRPGKRVHVGFPLLYVCMVALIGVMLGYLLRH